jgi:adenylylsulfate kinase-like enzyme
MLPVNSDVRHLPYKEYQKQEAFSMEAPIARAMAEEPLLVAKSELSTFRRDRRAAPYGLPFTQAVAREFWP